MRVTKIKFSADQLESKGAEKIYLFNPGQRAMQQSFEEDIERKVLEFTLEGNTTWICDAHTMYRLFPEADNLQLKRGKAEALEIPAYIDGSDAQRGILGKAAVKVLKIFAKPVIADTVDKLAEKLELKNLDNITGLKRLAEDFSLHDIKKLGEGEDYLLFIHGTGSCTRGSFGELAGTAVWQQLCKKFGQNILAFQHRSFSQSPLQNAAELSEWLPQKCRLHIVSHSRGGIVGDILCKFASDGEKNFSGFSKEQLDLLMEEKRNSDLSHIKKLASIYDAKEISVQRFVRVACPAAGTILASERLDVILNVLLNALSLVSDAADLLRELLFAVLDTKKDTAVLPGIEAMDPGSVFMKLMNDTRQEVQVKDDSLAIIAGNAQASMSKQGLVAILAKLFFWQRNDLVVNTDSMYLGCSRKEKIQYFFDEGKNVSHFDYFKNPSTREALLYAINTAPGKDIPGFERRYQHDIPAEHRGVLGLEGGELEPYPGIPTGQRPIVVLIPGIMGSNLSVKNKKQWLHYANIITGGLTNIDISNQNINANSIISSSYKKLAERLSNEYDVLIYPFDWRLQLNESAKAFETKINALLALNQPVKIVAHSMGGVLVRDFIVNYPETWNRLNNSAGFRLLFLGTPLGGSHRILTVLFGQDAIINKLSTIDVFHSKKRLLKMFVQFPGILSLLPLSDDEKNDFANPEIWKEMRNAHGEADWPLPSEKDLALFKEYRNKINSQKKKIDYSNMVYVAGQDRFTPCDYFKDETGPDAGLLFYYTSDGDQSVTWDTGIPLEIIEKGNVYYTDASHGKLSCELGLFNGYSEILSKGRTSLFSKERPQTRSTEKKFRLPEQYDFDTSNRGLEDSVFGMTTHSSEVKVSKAPLHVSIYHGDLAYASHPLIAGHFINDAILYAEKSIDEIFGGLLSRRHALNLYPGEIGSSILLTLPQETGNEMDNEFPGAIIVGLGDPDMLNGFKLAQTVEKAVCKYLINENAEPAVNKNLGISALIIGCGYGGLSIENSVKAIIEGVNTANKKVLEISGNGVELIRHIEFIELYEDKAVNCLLALRKIENTENAIYNISTVYRQVKKNFGARRRIPVDQTEQWWRRFTVKKEEGLKNENGKIERGKDNSLKFSSSVGRAREEEDELYNNTPLIDAFVKEISEDNNWNPCISNTLFELLLPNAFKDQLKMKGNIVWVLNRGAAAYPWELLQDSEKGATPLCIKAGMVRQLALNAYQMQVKTVASNHALVIADPLTGNYAPALPGAEKEGSEVEKKLAGHFEVKCLRKKNAGEIMQALFCNDYRIIHLAGHGVYDPDNPRKSGMLIGNDIFLTTFEIEQLSAIPELMFINCCFLGKADPDKEKLFNQRYKLAASIGTQLIAKGVKSVVVAGWAIDDSAALLFAQVFYDQMLSGKNFGEAVRVARENVYLKFQLQNNTWGAYQCYGDPYYKLTNSNSGSSNNSKNLYNLPQELYNELYDLRNRVNSKKVSAAAIIKSLEAIIKKKKLSGFDDFDTLETEMVLYYELGLYDKAVECFKNLSDMASSSNFSLSSAQKYLNASCKLAFSDRENPDKTLSRLQGVLTDVKAIDVLKRSWTAQLIEAGVYKRIAYFKKSSREKMSAIGKAMKCYEKCAQYDNNLYSLKNYAMMHLVMEMHRTKKVPSAAVKQDMLNKLEAAASMSVAADENMSYWKMIKPTYHAFISLLFDDAAWGEQAGWKHLENCYKAAWRRGGSPGKKMAELEGMEILIDVLTTLKINSRTLKKLILALNALQQNLKDYYEGKK